MADLKHVKKGDTVLVHDINRKIPPVEGVVEKDGPKLLHVRYRNVLEVFRRDSGHKNNDAYGHIWINTPEQEDENRRRSSALKFIDEKGLCFHASSNGWSLERLEALADFLRESEEGVICHAV